MRFLMIAILAMASLPLWLPAVAPPPPQVLARAAAEGEYRDSLAKAARNAKGATDPDFYHGFIFKNKKTGEERKLRDLPPLDQGMFILSYIERANNEIASEKHAWLGQFKGYDALSEEKRKAMPSKEDLESYMEQMHFWHKKLAAKHRSHAERLFKAHPDRFTKEEAEAYLKRLAEYQAKNGLGGA